MALVCSQIFECWLFDKCSHSSENRVCDRIFRGKRFVSLPVEVTPVRQHTRYLNNGVDGIQFKPFTYIISRHCEIVFVVHAAISIHHRHSWYAISFECFFFNLFSFHFHISHGLLATFDEPTLFNSSLETDVIIAIAIHVIGETLCSLLFIR